MLFDLRLAALHLWRRPSFTATALLLLALGAGANAAVFSVVRAVLWRPLAFSAPDRLVAIWPDEPVSNEEIALWRARVPSLADVAGISPGWLMAIVSAGVEPISATGARVSGNLFELLGARAASGRALTDADSAPGAPRVAVLSDRVWRQRFGADPAVLGRSVRIDEVPHEVVGVMRADFEVLGFTADLFVALPFAPGTPAQRTTYSLALGRLRAGSTPEMATRELVALVPELRRVLGHPDDWGHTVRAEPLADVTTGPVRPSLILLLAAVGLVLLLGAANLGALALGRSVERLRELAVRSAIGASRSRLVRQIVVEHTLLGALGGLAGLGLAWLVLPALIAGLPPEVPRQHEIALDRVVFGLVWLLSVVVAASTATAPALLALGAGAQPVLRQHQQTSSPARRWLLGGLVSVQVALAVVLGAGAGLMLRSMWHLQRVQPGFEPTGAITFRAQTTARHRTLTSGLPYLRQLGERITGLPGVTFVGAINHLPMSGYSWTMPLRRADTPVTADAPAPIAWRFVWGDYFQAMRIPLVAGRLFATSDARTAAEVAIVNERFARAWYGSATAALGQRLVQRNMSAGGETTAEIVGVVGDVRHAGLDRLPEPEYYRPIQQTFMFPMQIVIRAGGDPAALAGAVRRAAFDVDPAVPVGDPRPLTVLLASTLGRPRLLASLLSMFAASGLLLSVVGLYGVVALHVRQRQREIGIRLALGATARGVARRVVGEGLRHTGIGLALGVPTALLLAGAMESLLYGVTASDPLTFGLLPVLLTAAAAAASYAPARRASRVDPAVTLRDVV